MRRSFPPPVDRVELLIGPAAVRFAKTIGNKLARRYDRLQHVAGSITQIALKVGYEAPSSVAARFRQRMGMTPSQYRRRL